MKIFLTGNKNIEELKNYVDANIKNVLLSYINFYNSKDKRNIHEKLWGMKKNRVLDYKVQNVLSKFNEVMIDSGAFSYMNDSVKKQKPKELDKFAESYGKWLRDNRKFYHYFEELDLDFLVGIKKVEEYRIYLEKCAGRQCIPVWHINRGLEYWEKMTIDYKYVAIGGMVTGEITGMEKYANFLINIAHQNNCKVHGLGYTKLRCLKYIPFDSVDSITFRMGSIVGAFFSFFDGQMHRIDPPELKGRYNKSSKISHQKYNTINLKAWKDYSDYIEDYWKRQKEEELLIKKEMMLSEC